MVSKRKLKLSSRDTTSEEADAPDFLLKLAEDHSSSPRPLKRLKNSAPTSIRRSKLLPPISQSEYDFLSHAVDTDVSLLDGNTAQAHNVDSASLEIRPLRTWPLQGHRIVTRSSKLPQSELSTTYPDQSPDYRQRDSHSTWYARNDNSLLNPLVSPDQKPAVIILDNGLGYLNQTLPATVSLTQRISNYKPSENHKQGRQRALDLPLDIWYLIADHLDVVALVCLTYTYPALGHWSKQDSNNLSPCARSAIVSLLKRDGASIPEELLAMAAKSRGVAHCLEYHNLEPKYCLVCRCSGHIARCPECQIRTCARQGM